jgi:hypothetical protein
MKFFLGSAVACSGVAMALASAAGCGAATSPLLLFEDGGASDGAGSSSGGSSGSSGGVSSSGSGGSSGGSGGSSGAGSGGSSGSSGSGSGGSSSSSGGGSGSSSGSSSSSGGSSDGGTGSLYFEQCAGSSSLCGGTQGYFFGSFTQGPTTSCAPTLTSGGCMLYTNCNTAPTPGVSAGTITISGGDLAGGIAVMAAPNNFEEYVYMASGSLFSAGQTLTLVASGATVPAFGPVSVIAPPNVTLTAPAATSTGYTIATSTDLGVAWNGGRAGDQVIFEGAANPMGQTQSYFVCTWDASVGMASVPQAILAGLAGQSNGILYYGQIATTNLGVGGYMVSVNALPFGGGSANFR